MVHLKGILWKGAEMVNELLPNFPLRRAERDMNPVLFLLPFALL